jgi:hypothetical protein
MALIRCKLVLSSLIAYRNIVAGWQPSILFFLEKCRSFVGRDGLLYFCFTFALLFYLYLLFSAFT